MSEWSHAQLCDIAVRWLKRPNSQKGHGCCAAFAEVRSGWTGEVPDAIGFRRKGAFDDGSVVVEVKVSRSDFLADAKKPHRAEGGLGNWRYFMCPEGVIQWGEVPEGWGLLWVNKRGHVVPQSGPALTMRQTTDYLAVKESIQAAKQESDHERELFIVVRMLSRVADPSSVHEGLKERDRLARKCDKQAEEIRKLRFDVFRWKGKVEGRGCA